MENKILKTRVFIVTMLCCFLLYSCNECKEERTDCRTSCKAAYSEETLLEWNECMLNCIPGATLGPETPEVPSDEFNECIRRCGQDPRIVLDKCEKECDVAFGDCLKSE